MRDPVSSGGAADRVHIFLLSAIGAISIEYLPDFYVIFLLFSERGLIPCLNSKIFSWPPWAVGHPKAVEI